jgi:hypothetical protein
MANSTSQTSNSTDTRYYDELFKRLKGDSDEFSDEESLGLNKFKTLSISSSCLFYLRV